MQETLSHYFGYETFRPGQKEIITKILDHRNTLSFTFLNTKTAAAPSAVNNHVMIPAVSAWIYGGRFSKNCAISMSPCII